MYVIRNETIRRKPLRIFYYLVVLEGTESRTEGGF